MGVTFERDFVWIAWVRDSSGQKSGGGCIRYHYNNTELH